MKRFQARLTATVIPKRCRLPKRVLKTLDSDFAVFEITDELRSQARKYLDRYKEWYAAELKVREVEYEGGDVTISAGDPEIEEELASPFTDGFFCPECGCELDDGPFEPPIDSVGDLFCYHCNEPFFREYLQQRSIDNN